MLKVIRLHYFQPGTFGQSESWDVYNMKTYQHPMVPYDVLIDPLSLPSVPSVTGKVSMQQVINEDNALEEVRNLFYVAFRWLLVDCVLIMGHVGHSYHPEANMSSKAYYETFIHKTCYVQCVHFGRNHVSVAC